ncbi:uncharacterized protein LOC131032945 [Cryptomeria japonica]|uniref:uncharacterized protein LOC131032945 n=1 Tax=Cryptomeria japonica TaxID=3369 RepID=UPI0025AC49A6|nr:uncharacterized protein LOC131032945 [Cryptomeria japonica]
MLFSYMTILKAIPFIIIQTNRKVTPAVEELFALNEIANFEGQRSPGNSAERWCCCVLHDHLRHSQRDFALEFLYSWSHLCGTNGNKNSVNSINDCTLLELGGFTFPGSINKLQSCSIFGIQLKI